MKLKICTDKNRAIALTIAILWGASLMIITLISCYTGYASEFLNLISSIYIGYNISLIGSVIGFIYGFIDGFITVYIFIVIYNFIYHRIKNC